MSYEGEARATPITKGLGLLTYLVLLCSVLRSELRARQDLVAASALSSGGSTEMIGR